MNPQSLEIPLSDIDDCFQGLIPTPICTTARDGTPNVTYLSLVQRLDDAHVALSGQFFNKTMRNLLENPRAQALVTDSNCRQFRLDLLYERTETQGELFETLSSRLDAIASYTGMESIFKLQSVEVFTVLGCSSVPAEGDVAVPQGVQVNLGALQEFARRVSDTTSVDDLVSTSLGNFADLFGYDRSILLLVNETGDGLYTVASHGFSGSGVGSEVKFGEGVIGVTAERKRLIRFSNMAHDRTMVAAVRSSVRQAGADEGAVKEISLPGLARPLSEMAVPLQYRDELLGVLCLQSPVRGQFRPVDEQVVSVAAHYLALAITLLRVQAPADPPITANIVADTASGPSAGIRYYAADDSIFIDNKYLIKGVAGRVLWRLLTTYQRDHRSDFSNREIRLDAWLDLPYMRNNLETRLVMLKRRLLENCDFLRIVQTGRGRFRLDVQREIDLQEVLVP